MIGLYDLRQVGGPSTSTSMVEEGEYDQGYEGQASHHAADNRPNW